MEFGRVTNEELAVIDFKLPPDPAFNKTTLSGIPSPNFKIWLGLSKWGRTEWVGKLYPPKTKEKDFLSHYVKHFNAIELNATHYKIFGDRGTAKWGEKAGGKEFLFCPKSFKGVTHHGKLNGKEFLQNEFIRGIGGFGNHLGPCFISLAENFSPKRWADLEEYLKKLPTVKQFFLEVRHPDWFSKPDLFVNLQKLNIGAVITDTAGRRDCMHMYLPIPSVFIRFVANDNHSSDRFRLEQWAKRLKDWKKKGLMNVYFFVHSSDETYSPDIAQIAIELFNKELDAHLQPLKFL
jgi:uncharacterized protein YecE (DUF72 family)